MNFNPLLLDTVQYNIARNKSEEANSDRLTELNYYDVNNSCERWTMR